MVLIQILGQRDVDNTKNLDRFFFNPVENILSYQTTTAIKGTA